MNDPNPSPNPDDTLQTERLIIRPFTPADMPAIHHILVEAFGDSAELNDPIALELRHSWLEWSMLSQLWLPKMQQLPYGDRAIERKQDGRLMGSCGYVPLLEPFDQIPELSDAPQPSGFYTPEVGLFWAVDPAQQRQGYATEAARALIDYAFTELRLRRLLATTRFDNAASQGVMRKLGMTITRNPQPEPPWLQVVGVLWNEG